MVRAEIFGFDPLLVFAACMLGIIILAFIILSNEDVLLVLVNAGILILATLILVNLFEYSVFAFDSSFQLAILHMTAMSGQPTYALLYMILNMDLQPIVTMLNYAKYTVLGVIILLTIVKGYSALRGGWKTLKPDQFKEK